MKKTLLLAILCAAALTACAEKKTDNAHETEPTTEITTIVTTEAVTTAVKATTTTAKTTTATTATTVTTTTTVNSADKKIGPELGQITTHMFDEFEFNTLEYYNGRTYDSTTEEERNSSNSPFYDTLEGELTDEHKQMLYDYFIGHEFEEVDYNEVHYLWDCGLPHDKTPEKSLIWLPMTDKKEWLESGHTPHLGGCLEIIFSYDKQYFAIRQGTSGHFYTYKTAAPEELQFLYDLVP